MSLDHAILGFLAARESSGYDLKTRAIDERTSHFWTADQAQVYRTLERLRQRGWVRTHTQRQRTRPDRKVYEITPAGYGELDAWVAGAHVLPPHRDPFLIQLLFLDRLPDDVALDVLQTQRRAYQSRLDELRDRASDHARATGTAPDKGALFERMTIDGAIAHVRSAIDWLDDCIETLSALPQDEDSQRRLFTDRQITGGAR